MVSFFLNRTAVRTLKLAAIILLFLLNFPVVVLKGFPVDSGHIGWNKHSYKPLKLILSLYLTVTNTNSLNFMSESIRTLQPKCFLVGKIASETHLITFTFLSCLFVFTSSLAFPSDRLITDKTHLYDDVQPIDKKMIIRWRWLPSNPIDPAHNSSNISGLSLVSVAVSWPGHNSNQIKVLMKWI